MKKKIRYESNPFGKVRLGKQVKLAGLPLALPTPRELAEAEQTTKITLSLSSRSLRFFKEQADQFDIPYQVMIRRLLDEYASR
ncbi:MAG: CopG family transcriptional regulator [Alphaproteobacteria bacterium]|nr:CopG family transcriptional regulator [Alphaproteobacteria bacterium]